MQTKYPKEVLIAISALYPALCRIEALLKYGSPQEDDPIDTEHYAVLTEASQEAVKVIYHALDTLDQFGIYSSLSESGKTWAESFALLRKGCLMPKKKAA